jgi:cell division protein FtsX
MSTSLNIDTEDTFMSSIHHVEVVIHVDEALDDEQQQALITSLQKHAGIEKARFTKGRDHLMVIDYDSNKLQTTDVLNLVKQENFNAELIGI